MESALFQITNAVALAAWILLAVFTYKPWIGKFIVGVVITGLTLLYTGLVFSAFSPEDVKNFGTLEGIKGLFADDRMVLVGWIHYLAFDLLAGWYITRDANRHQISRLILLPCLLFTFMLGPFGLLLYFLARFSHTRKHFHE